MGTRCFQSWTRRVPPATQQCPYWSSSSGGEQGPARRPHQRRQRVSLGTACRPVSNPWVRPAHREREILRPPPSPPCRPAAAGRPPRRRATEPECGTQWPRSEKPFFRLPLAGRPPRQRITPVRRPKTTFWRVAARRLQSPRPPRLSSFAIPRLELVSIASRAIKSDLKRSDPLAEHGSSPLPSLCRRG